MQICKAGTGTFTGDLTQCQCCRFGASWSWCQCWFKAVLLSQNYLFLAPTTAPAIYCHLKPYFYQGSEPACFEAAQAPKKNFQAPSIAPALAPDDIAFLHIFSVLWIRIRMNPELLPGSGSGIIDPDPVKF